MKTVAFAFLPLLIAASAWADAIPAEDPSIQPPDILGVRVYVDEPNPVFAFHWTHVPGAVAYQIWREVWVTQRLGDDDELISLGDPSAEFIPWQRIDIRHDDPALDPSEDTEVTISAPVDPQDNVVTRWAISAEVELDGTSYRSPLSIYDLSAVTPFLSPTAVEAKSWGLIKRGF